MDTLTDVPRTRDILAHALRAFASRLGFLNPDGIAFRARAHCGDNRIHPVSRPGSRASSRARARPRDVTGNGIGRARAVPRHPTARKQRARSVAHEQIARPFALLRIGNDDRRRHALRRRGHSRGPSGGGRPAHFRGRPVSAKTAMSGRSSSEVLTKTPEDVVFSGSYPTKRCSDTPRIPFRFSFAPEAREGFARRKSQTQLPTASQNRKAVFIFRPIPYENRFRQFRTQRTPAGILPGRGPPKFLTPFRNRGGPGRRQRQAPHRSRRGVLSLYSGRCH